MRGTERETTEVLQRHNQTLFCDIRQPELQHAIISKRKYVLLLKQEIKSAECPQ
jgi:hypothetical protein